MTIVLFGAIEAEGSAEELALYSTLFFSGIKEVKEIQEDKMANQGLEELFKSIDESMKKKGDDNQV